MIMPVSHGKLSRESEQVCEELYRTGPGGICGNEDMGSLSSWYVLSSMGFYPVTPGSQYYAIGSPLFGEVTIDPGEWEEIYCKGCE